VEKKKDCDTGRRAVLTRHVVYGHGVLTYHALPILVGEQLEGLATGHRPGVEPGAESFHGSRFAHRHRCLDTLTQHPQIVRVREIVVVQKRVLVGVVVPEQYATPALGPQQHREHAEHVLVAEVAQQLVVEFVTQTMRLSGCRSAVRVGRRGRQHELDVRPVVRLVTVFGRDKCHGLQSYGRRQWSFAKHGIPIKYRRCNINNIRTYIIQAKY